MKSCGALFYSIETGRILLGLRDMNKTHGGEFSLIGGKINNNETVLEGLIREIKEEIGEIPTTLKIIPYDVFSNTKHNFEYISYVFLVKEEFIPKINYEHCGYMWVNPTQIPKNIHPGAKKSLHSKLFISSLKKIRYDYLTQTSTK